MINNQKQILKSLTLSLTPCICMKSYKCVLWNLKFSLLQNVLKLYLLHEQTDTLAIVFSLVCIEFKYQSMGMRLIGKSRSKIIYKLYIIFHVIFTKIDVGAMKITNFAVISLYIIIHWEFDKFNLILVRNEQVNHGFM